MSICIQDIVSNCILSNQGPISAKHHQRKARKEMITTTSYERTGPITKWPSRRLQFTLLEIVTAPNATEAERPFYERSRMVLHVTRRLLLQLLASVLSSHVRFQILDSSYISLNCVDGIIDGKATE